MTFMFLTVTKTSNNKITNKKPYFNNDYSDAALKNHRKF